MISVVQKSPPSTESYLHSTKSFTLSTESDLRSTKSLSPVQKVTSVVQKVTSVILCGPISGTALSKPGFQGMLGEGGGGGVGGGVRLATDTSITSRAKASGGAGGWRAMIF